MSTDACEKTIVFSFDYFNSLEGLQAYSSL